MSAEAQKGRPKRGKAGGSAMRHRKVVQKVRDKRGKADKHGGVEGTRELPERVKSEENIQNTQIHQAGRYMAYHRRLFSLDAVNRSRVLNASFI